jgi:eukaryotic-like serine/threonine-protein kinase
VVEKCDPTGLIRLSDRLEHVFQQAWDVSGEARARLLDELCAGDDALRRTAEQLLAAAEETERSVAWNQPAILLEATATARQEQASELGRYKLLEAIGTGGMGVVYKAVRADDAFSKLVAVKIVQCGAADDKILRRFVQERQILAVLEHPNIARLLDGGATPEGLPFLVMEYVDGVPIDQYLAKKKPGLDELLDLFRKICSAVSYAHRNLIVHRDLKPDNVLVTVEGEPKLLDFGIAKLLDGSSVRTKTENAAMTPEHASPEQIQGAPISTASDIYSLGVLLYGMLTGRRPYRDTAGALELAQAIAIENPRTLTEASSRNFDSDLENIVQMALRKEPARRYASVDQFAEDIRRYREGYPVSARPDTRGYRAKKFVGRNKAAVTAATLAFVALVAGSAAIWRQAQVADQRFNDVRRLANSYLFEFHDAIKNLPGATAARQLVVKRAIEFLDNLAKQRGNNVELGRELATAYEKAAEIQGDLNVASMGDQRGALVTYRRALAIRQALAAGSPSNVDVTRELAFSYAEVGWLSAYTGDVASGVEDLRKAVALGQKAVAARPADPKVREGLALSLSGLGDVLGNPNYQNLGDVTGAIQLYRQGLDIREKLFAEDPASLEKQTLLASSYSRLAQVLQAIDDKAGAVAAYRRAADISDELMRRAPGNSQFRRGAAAGNRNLALSLLRINAVDEARKRGDKSMEIFERIATDDPQNVQARIEVAESYYSQGNVRAGANDNEAALRFCDSAVAIFESVAAEHPADPPRLGLRSTYRLLADLNLKVGNSARAVVSAQRELTIDDQLLKADPKNASAERNQGLALRQIAQAHESNGMRPGAPRAMRIAELHEAKSWYRRSLAVFQAQKDKGTLIPMYKAELDKTPVAIAKCDNTLAALGGR